jgi:hypothetical protein
MTSSRPGFNRRRFLGTIVAGAALGLPLSGRTGQPPWPQAPSGPTPSAFAVDESYWSGVAAHYDRTVGIVNLEHGYWGKMAHPVQDAYIQATRMVNSQNSFYVRRDGATGRRLEEIGMTKHL